MHSININEKFNLFQETWTPKIIGELNGQYVKLAKLEGEFVWHDHANEDELFMVFKGTLFMDLKKEDGSVYTETIKEGETLIVPKGVQHRPRTNGELVHVLLFEPKSTAHTGDVVHELTKHSLEHL